MLRWRQQPSAADRMSAGIALSSTNNSWAPPCKTLQMSAMVRYSLLYIQHSPLPRLHPFTIPRNRQLRLMSRSAGTKGKSIIKQAICKWKLLNAVRYKFIDAFFLCFPIIFPPFFLSLLPGFPGFGVFSCETSAACCFCSFWPINQHLGVQIGSLLRIVAIVTQHVNTHPHNW